MLRKTDGENYEEIQHSERKMEPEAENLSQTPVIQEYRPVNHEHYANLSLFATYAFVAPVNDQYNVLTYFHLFSRCSYPKRYAIERALL